VRPGAELLTLRLNLINKTGQQVTPKGRYLTQYATQQNTQADPSSFRFEMQHGTDENNTMFRQKCRCKYNIKMKVKTRSRSNVVLLWWHSNTVQLSQRHIRQNA